MDLDLSIVLILLKGVIVAVVEHFDSVVVGMALATFGDGLDFQVVSHQPQKKIYMIRKKHPINVAS